MLIKENIGFKIKALTSRKFFGKYYHSIASHMPDQLRIISVRASNTEKEECQFNFIKNITKATSNNHPNNVITNALIRMKVSEDLNERRVVSTKLENDISKMYKNIECNLENSFVSFDIMK